MCVANSRVGRKGTRPDIYSGRCILGAMYKAGPSSISRPVAAERKRKLSRQGLNLALKAVISRAVREEGKAALKANAARLGGQQAERDRHVARARGREKMRVALMRVNRPGAMYGDAVQEANLRCVNGDKRKKGCTPWR